MLEVVLNNGEFNKLVKEKQIIEARGDSDQTNINVIALSKKLDENLLLVEENGICIRRLEEEYDYKYFENDIPNDEPACDEEEDEYIMQEYHSLDIEARNQNNNEEYMMLKINDEKTLAIHYSDIYRNDLKISLDEEDMIDEIVKEAMQFKKEDNHEIYFTKNKYDEKIFTIAFFTRRKDFTLVTEFKYEGNCNEFYSLRINKYLVTKNFTIKLITDKMELIKIFREIDVTDDLLLDMIKMFYSKNVDLSNKEDIEKFVTMMEALSNTFEAIDFLFKPHVDNDGFSIYNMIFQCNSYRNDLSIVYKSSNMNDMEEAYRFLDYLRSSRPIGAYTGEITKRCMNLSYEITYNGEDRKIVTDIHTTYSNKYYFEKIDDLWLVMTNKDKIKETEELSKILDKFEKSSN